MLEVSLVVANIQFRVSPGSAAATGSDLDLGSSGDIIIPSSIFFSSPTAAPRVTRIDRPAFQSTQITSILIPRHVQIICS
jgi:hypothetical protein